MKTNANDPINPYRHLNCNGIIDAQYDGLTKREYFAALAMQGLLSNDEHIKDDKSYPEITADLSVQYADALIEQLNKDK